MFLSMRRGRLMLSGTLQAMTRAAAKSRLLRRFGKDSRGVTTIEFAFVAMPFFVLVMGIMTIGTQFLAMHSLENGVANASRKIRTGEAQTQGLTLGTFRQAICDAAGSVIPCNSNLVVHVRSATTFVGLTPPPSCTTSSGSLAPASGSMNDLLSASTGQENMKVLVTACYHWQAGAGFWQVIWNLLSPTPRTQGQMILSAAAVFQTEPYK
jgi:Flp pilus assembly pilin Flp